MKAVYQGTIKIRVRNLKTIDIVDRVREDATVKDINDWIESQGIEKPYSWSIEQC